MLLTRKKQNINSDDCCFNCQHAKQNTLSSDVLCKYNGLVAGNGICKKHKKNLFMLKPKKKRTISGDFTAEDFSIE